MAKYHFTADLQFDLIGFSSSFTTWNMTTYFIVGLMYYGSPTVDQLLSDTSPYHKSL